MNKNDNAVHHSRSLGTAQSEGHRLDSGFPVAVTWLPFGAAVRCIALSFVLPEEHDPIRDTGSWGMAVAPKAQARREALPDGDCLLDGERITGHALTQESGGIGKEANFVPIVEPASDVGLSDGPGTMERGEFGNQSTRSVAHADDLTFPVWMTCNVRATYYLDLSYEGGICPLPTILPPQSAGIAELGADSRDARRRRQLPMAVVAERAFTSRDPSKGPRPATPVSASALRRVLQALGLLDGLSQIADIGNDSVGQALASAELPRLVHLRRPPDHPAWLTSRSISTLMPHPADRAGEKHRVRGRETIVFGYDDAWLADPDRFSLEPALPWDGAPSRRPLASRPSVPSVIRRPTAGSSVDAARRAPPRRTRRPRRSHAPGERYLLGVTDETRSGALRFRWAGDNTFQALPRAGVPALIELGRLLRITERILRDEETMKISGSSSLPAPSWAVRARRRRSSISTASSRSPSFRRRQTITAWKLGGDCAASRRPGRHRHACARSDRRRRQEVMLPRRFDRQGAIRIPSCRPWR